MTRFGLGQIGLLLSATSLLACGAKTGLRVWPIDASPDVPDVVDVPIITTDAGAQTYLGTEFWAVSTANSLLQIGNTFHFGVAIGNPTSSTVTATIDRGVPDAAVHVTIPPNDTVTTRLAWVRELVQNSGEYSGCSGGGFPGTPAVSSLVPWGAYHIVTSAPVSVYQFNPLEFRIGDNGPCSPRSYTNDASLLLPTPALTGNYLVLAHNSFGDAGSYVAIASASPDPITVTVNLSANIRAGMGVAAATAGSTVEYNLNQGDVVQLLSEGDSAGSAFGDDMTGTVVRATGPVAVFSGVDCTNMSWPDGEEPACDHLEQQLFPEETWGRSAIVSQLQDRGTTEAFMVRILSRDNGNTIRFTPPSTHEPVQLDRGHYVEFESTADFVVEGDTPILVAQFMEGQNTTPDAAMGDPAMVLEVPLEQFRRDYEFVIPATYTASFINVVSHADAVLVLDGMVMTETPTPIAGTPWVVRRKRVQPGSRSLTTTDDAGVGLKVVGVAEYTSYMYPGGLDLTRNH